MSSKSDKKRQKPSLDTPPTVIQHLEIPDDVVPKEIQDKVKSASENDILCKSYPYRTKMKREKYEKTLKLLQIEMLKLQRWATENGERIVLLFEGRDAAGKGGTIKRFMEHLNPRGARVVALAKPSETERGQWYFQRYMQHLPTNGEIVLFDRSWYNRGVVEPVMNFCRPHEHHTFLREAPQLENMLVNSGIHFFKLWFSVSREEQFRRFKARETDKLKHWKLTSIDIKSLGLWDEYTEAQNTMLMATDTKASPWTVIHSDDKRRARLSCLSYVLDQIDYTDKDQSLVGKFDSKIIGSKEMMYDTSKW
ncbi:MAG: polyphosphate kinase 2 [Planctomycetes bacterium]|nr:polyphosphate kinase 2 [Planctomycetota bacterium]MCH9727331.1 polyphosphate kinase 2 [Planctomycetota bacterium]MCH9777009.1 polyphosphate kinase 2 [Planctomycetota bacterium]MCH9790396.1 polyphosphate kinase 2 [Planctomycetota bacterium]MDF1745139.1 polyphosphate kinase 2 [Gimesia sp.]